MRLGIRQGISQVLWFQSTWHLKETKGTSVHHFNRTNFHWLLNLGTNLQWQAEDLLRALRWWETQRNETNAKKNKIITYKYIKYKIHPGCDRFSPKVRSMREFCGVSSVDAEWSTGITNSQSMCVVLHSCPALRPVTEKSLSWVNLKLKIHLKTSSWAPSERLNMRSGEPSVCSTTLYGISSKAISTKLN